jgi:hypothetical protein
MTRRIPARHTIRFGGAVLAALIALITVALADGSPARAEGAGIGWEGSIAAKKGKARTIAELAAMYDSAPCAECHKEVHDQWRKSSHFIGLLGEGRTADGLLAYIRDGLMTWRYSGVKGAGDVRVEHLMACAKCHLPQLADAEDAVAREIVAALVDRQEALDKKDQAAADKASDKLRSLNVGCTICHNRNALIHKWADGYPGASEIYGSKDGAHPGAFTTLKKSPVIGESILCGQCHGLGPNLDLANPNQCTTLYGSYIYAYRAHGGKESCQDCHMRRNKVGHETKPLTDPEMIRQTLDVKTQTHGFFWRTNREDVPRVIVDVTITNLTGHSIPDSISANHRLVLTVAAKNDEGELFKERRVYMQVPQRLGRGGKMGRTAFEKTGILEDTTLSPYNPVLEKFDFTLEAGSSGKGKSGKMLSELEVSVTLRQLSADDSPDTGGILLYETNRDVTIEER